MSDWQGGGVPVNGGATYDITTDIGKVRLLVQDSDISDPLFTDAEIDVFLSMYYNDVFMVSSLLLRQIAVSKAMLEKKIKAGNYSEDNTTLAKRLLEISDKYQHMSESIPADATAEMIPNVFQYDTVYVDRIFRGESE